MVVLNLYDTGIEAREFTAYAPQTEKVRDWLLAVFQPGPNGISWGVFGRVFREMARIPSFYVYFYMLTVIAFLILRSPSAFRPPGP